MSQRPINLRTIVVGVDGSANARAALDWAITLAEPVGARIVAVHALGLMDRLDRSHVPTAIHRDEIVAEFSSTWCAALDDATVPNDRLAADGPPADVILATARDRDADLVVVGERGTGAGPARDLGSTSRRVLEGTDRPVLVVPGPDGP
jgi:nucleotide-binding universal stress UspA family protein